ncbi:hypothetical protein ACLMJK_007453 [Lecanora helva]
MSKKPFKSQASSSRAVNGALGAYDGRAFATGFGSSTFGAVASSPLSYVYEPPDLSGLSDPNVGVAFKNIQKKDDTTKAKALEDLQAHVSSLSENGNGLEEAMLEAWIKVYPRTSIDSSRRVRQLAHTAQGQIAHSCGKRMARHMPAIVASWLAGLYDNDKSVNRAAHESFNQVFSSEEKRVNVWRLYQSSILDYSTNVVAKETASSLSDERTVSPDDSSAKYSRVVGAATMMVTSLLESVSEADLEKSSSLLNEFVNEEKLWKLASHTDPFVRRALYRLLTALLAKRKEMLNPSVLSANIVTSGLHTNQTGSALDFAKAISRLSMEMPDVWTVHYSGTGRKSAQSRLTHFLKRGSYGGPPEFWSCISTLLNNIPLQLLASPIDDDSTSKSTDEVRAYSGVLSALHEGINSKDEGRLNQVNAWTAYLDVFVLVHESLSESVDQKHFKQAALYPILTQFIRPTMEQSSWTVSGPHQRDICIQVCRLALSHDRELFEQEWLALSMKVIEDLQISQPEQSKEYAKSQEAIVAETGRWYQLHAFLLDGPHASLVGPMVKQTLPREISSACATIKNRNGKPYGAAYAVGRAIQFVSPDEFGGAEFRETVVDFANNVIPELILSPSARYLIQMLRSLEGKQNVDLGYKRCLRKLMESTNSDARTIALESLIASPRLVKEDSLRAAVANALHDALKENDEPSWKLVMAAITNPAAPKQLTDEMLANMIDGLSIEAAAPASLHGLEMTANRTESILKEITLSPKGATLLSALLSLSNSSDEIVAQKAQGLSGFVEQTMKTDGDSDQASRSMLEVIYRGINTAGIESLPVNVLLSKAQGLMDQAPSEELLKVATKLLPDQTQWTAGMEPFISLFPNPSIAITNSFGGAISLIDSAYSIPIRQSVSRDADGYSSAFRMAWFTTNLISTTMAFDSLAPDHKTAICSSLELFLQLAGDNLSISGSVPLWQSIDTDHEAHVIDLIAATQKLLASWFRRHPSPPDFALDACKILLHGANGLTSHSYYHGRAYATIATEMAESHMHLRTESDLSRIKAIRKSLDVFGSAAYLMSASDSKDVLRLSNEILAELTVLELEGHMEEGLSKLVYLTCLLHSEKDYVSEIPQQRLVFFVKHIIQQLQVAPPMSSIRGQIASILTVVLPSIKGIYGGFWTDILAIIEKDGLRATEDEALFCAHANLRLLSLLRKAEMQEANDDLLDSWNERKDSIGAALIKLMVQVSDDSHQPRRTINELLGRQLDVFHDDLKPDAGEMYPVIASESPALQEAAYGLLHRHVPALQEQTSIDKALSPDYIAQIPQELLSLILTAPDLEFLSESSFDRTMPSSLRSYLMSWKLTFDHWQGASYQVQADYVTALQEGSYVQDFLRFAFDILINARKKPVDASKFEFDKYSPRIEESPEKETYWLLIHIYYLCLRHLPSVTKTWWRDDASRQLNLAVSLWTEKYISPTIIASELSTITSWGPSQATAEQPMTIKVSTSAREITASIPVDEQTMTIAIHLPKSYPLARAEVTSVHRVAVPEKKWNSWLISAQGVINFSFGGAGEGNAIIDGLMAWRKNVTATMKGQSESAEQEVPDVQEHVS